MFTVINSSYLHLESLINAPFDQKEERGFHLVYSDKNKLEENAVAKDAGLSE